VSTLDRRVAIVTGSSRGIGAAIARALAAAGARVVLAARSEEELRALADKITRDGAQALAVPTDVTDPVSVRRLVEQTLGAYGRLDIAINGAAGGGHPPTPLAEVSVEDFDSALTVSLRGVFLAMKYEIPAMLANGGGAIVNIASTAGLEAVGGLSGYVSSKFGLIGLTRTAALDYADAGVRVNALAPGPILTERLREAGERARTQAASTLPIRRLGTPEEVAAAVRFLAGEHAGYITGQVLAVDGGLSML
jgi:NAD(P)-dependent dehydrogenase (short-subunit alcohol dehydrogenase family)